MIDKLIEKYDNKQSDDEVLTYSEILQDLEELKKTTKDILSYYTLSEMHDGVKYEIIGDYNNE